MSEVSRKPGNIFEVGSAILAILAYMSSYNSVMAPHVPGNTPAKFQVGILGLILLAFVFVLLYLSSIRTAVLSEN